MKSKQLRAAGLGGDYEIAGGTVASVTTSITSLSVAYPSGIQAGDLLVMLGTTANPGSFVYTSASGWTQILVDPYAINFWKIATGSETGSQTVTYSQACNGGGAQMFRIRRTSKNRLAVYDYISHYASTFNVAPPLQRFNGIDLMLYTLCTPGGDRTISSAPTGFTAITIKTTNVPMFSYYAINRGTGNINGSVSGGALNLRCISINLG